MNRTSPKLPLIGDDELQSHVRRLLSTRPSSPEGSMRAPRLRERAKAKPQFPLQGSRLAALPCRQELFDALPDPVLVLGSSGFFGNARLNMALDEEPGIRPVRRGPIREEKNLDKPALLEFVRNAMHIGAPRIYCPIGHTVFEINVLIHEEASAFLYFIPVASWQAALPFSIRLALCLRLSGLALKQIAQVMGTSLYSVQHTSRYHGKDLNELRRLIAKAKPE